MGTQQRQFCLDMMRVTWIGADGAAKADCGIILEIDPAGGLIQTTVAIPLKLKIVLDTGMDLVQGRVTSCEEDPYGYIVDFAIEGGNHLWFPHYSPQFLHLAGR